MEPMKLTDYPLFPKGITDLKPGDAYLIPAPVAKAAQAVIERAEWIVKLLYDGGYVTAEPLNKVLAAYFGEATRDT